MRFTFLKPDGFSQFLLITVPVGLSYFAVIEKSAIIGIASVICMFLSVMLMPICRRRENLWMFLIAALTGIPVNAGIVKYAVRIISTGAEFYVMDYIRGIIIYLILFSIEELILGIVTRLIWKRQYALC